MYDCLSWNDRNNREAGYYHILKEKKSYKDLGSNYYNHCNQEKLIKRSLHSLEKLGVTVVIQPS